MMDDLATTIGTAAAVLTTASYIPQLKKSWQTRSAGDLSLRALLARIAGISGWVIYGLLKSDAVITGANGVSLLLLAGILYVKLREA